MNKTKTFGRDPSGGWRPTNESAFYMREVARVCEEASKREKIEVRFLESFVRERVGIKRAITGGGVRAALGARFYGALAGGQETSQMNEQPELKRDDVEALAGEMRDLKELLREISGKLGRIEKRLRAFFPGSFPENKARKEKALDLRENPPTMTPQQVLDFYTELVALARSGQEKEVEARAVQLAIPDLALLVRELGAPLGKKPSRTGLTKSLMGRLKESVLLSRHTNRPPAGSFLAGDTQESRNGATSEQESRDAHDDSSSQ